MNLKMQREKRFAVWTVTRQGGRLAETLLEKMPDATLFVPAGLKARFPKASSFETLTVSVRRQFTGYAGHLFIMAAGIVVRAIAPVIEDKTKDPAVVVMDELGRHCISLLSGHIGGANALAGEVADAVGATPVITTATDLNAAPAIDVLAVEQGLVIENPTAIKHVHMAFLSQEPVWLYDPRGIFKEKIHRSRIDRIDSLDGIPAPGRSTERPSAGIFVDDRVVALGDKVLVLRPPTLTLGIGCNRGTQMLEIKDLVSCVMAQSSLSTHSLRSLASIDLKADETGLLALSREEKLPILFFSKEELNSVTTVLTPSEAVRRAVGVRSVCEAAAILAAGNGELIVPKQKRRNATVAVARTPCMSWASAPGRRHTSPGGR
ncbi:MAG: cobalt-precorrin 5A hydrolase [Desulfobacteraceae bacterium]|jgi:cobalt-precorrin 5A hydrolase